MDLQTSLLTSKARESSGSETAKRYDFQKDFSLKLLIEKYLGQADFVVLFEFHDDILVVDSSINPATVNFYQVKTKATGHWTLNALLKAEEGEKSILSKMYLNKETFADHTGRLFLVSNAKFKIDLANGGKGLSRDDIVGTELAVQDIVKINEGIKNELGLLGLPQFELIGNFHVTNLSLGDSQNHCIGILANLINQISPSSKVNPNVAYRAIYDHIRKKSAEIFTEIEIKELKGGEFAKLVNLKGITRGEFQGILETIGVWKNPDEVWERIEDDLRQNGTPILEIKTYQRGWQMYRSNLVANLENTSLFKGARDFVKTRINDGDLLKLSIVPLSEILYTEMVTGKFKEMTTAFDQFVIKGLILNEIYEN